MIDINKMRLLVQDYKLAGSPVFVQAADMNEILDRPEAAEKVRDWNAERLEDAIEELKALRAKIEAAEKQKPVTLDHIACVDNGVLRFMTGRNAPAHDCELYAMPNGKAAPKLYALPGAKGESE